MKEKFNNKNTHTQTYARD